MKFRLIFLLPLAALAANSQRSATSRDNALENKQETNPFGLGIPLRETFLGLLVASCLVSVPHLWTGARENFMCDLTYNCQPHDRQLISAEVAAATQAHAMGGVMQLVSLSGRTLNKSASIYVSALIFKELLCAILMYLAQSHSTEASSALFAMILSELLVYFINRSI